MTDANVQKVKNEPKPASTKASSSEISLGNTGVGDGNNDSANEFTHTVPLLSEGLLAQLQPLLAQIEKQLREFEEKQRLLLEDITSTHERSNNQPNYNYISHTFSKLPEYQQKLQTIKQTMMTMIARSKILKSRTAHLKTLKQQRLAQIAVFQKRERRLDKTLLAAKVATPEVQLNARALR
ncbi:6268_t:CDS:2 [Paraglomus occultum]|uniref:6268_t:CDS:1 n=1 Tax=Paraglomus occultum TaxID=144539 RepID=A0A9N8Z6V9_9GLOM|nr:6268_t:CDS:2 [Paraglomus occultum]